MRRKIVITIDTGCRRRSGESEHDFNVRMDQALTLELNAWQEKPNWENWDLMSVAPYNKQGVFLSYWEYDPELHEDVKEEGPEDQEMPVMKSIMDEIFGRQTMHYLTHGDAIIINGETFKLVNFNQFQGGATVDFLHVAEDEDDSAFDRRPEPVNRRGFVQYEGPRGMGPRFRQR